jgi:hypothetical protein
MNPTGSSVAREHVLSTRGHALSGDIDIDTTSHNVRSAAAFFLTNLARIVGDAPVTAGDDEFDYFVPVAVSSLHAVDQQIARLQLEVQERFDIVLTAMPIPFAG